MTSFLRGLICGVVALSFASAIEFRGYKLYDPTNDTSDDMRVEAKLPVEVTSSKEYQVQLPPDSGKPEAFQVISLGRYSKVRIVRNHTKGTAHGVHLVYAELPEKVNSVFDVADGKNTSIDCEETDMYDGDKNYVRCIAIASGWMSSQLPTKLFIFQHVVHSRLHAFRLHGDTSIFYMLREDDKAALQVNLIDNDAPVKIWYIDNVKYDKREPLTMGFLNSNATKYGKKFAIIGEFQEKVKGEEEVSKEETGTPQQRKLNSVKKFYLLKRKENADVTKCMNEYVTLGTTRITFHEMVETIIFLRNMDQLLQAPNGKCFFVDASNGHIQKLTRTLETPEVDRPDGNDEVVIYEARASPSEPFYAVSLSYQQELDHTKHGHHFAMVNNTVFHLDDLRYAGEVLHPLDGHTDVVHLFRSSPAIKIKVLPYNYAFKAYPYWMDQRMSYMENEPLHNYYEAISHSGPPFEANNIWASIMITKDKCVNTSLPNASLASFVEHHQEPHEINGTTKMLERDMSQTYEEFGDLHVDQRSPCNDINVLSKIKRTTKNVSKKDNIVLETKDEEPLRMTLNLEEGERFRLRFFSVDREESKCQDLDTVAIFLKDDMLVNERAYIRTITYESLRTRNNIWAGMGKLTIAIPNGCFRVEIVSVFSIQRANNLRNIRACLIVLSLTIIMSGTVILLYYKFSLAGMEYRRLRHVYRKAKSHDNFVRHYLEWKENVAEIIAAWERVADDN